jgi:hypothetical protein
MLVLQFIPDAPRAVAEMRRVVRPGGAVTAAVWDSFGGQPHIRLVFDIAAVLDPTVERKHLLRPLTAPNEMAALWRELGLLEVEQTSLPIRMEFACFDDYWTPFTQGEGPPGQLVASLSGPPPVQRSRTMCDVRILPTSLMAYGLSRVSHGHVEELCLLN